MRGEDRTERPSDDLLRRYAAGASDREERARVDAWSEGHADRRAYLRALERAWRRGSAGVPDDELLSADAAWSALHARLNELGALPRAAEPSGVPTLVAPIGRSRRPPVVFSGMARRPLDRLVLRGAAAALVIAAGGAGALHFLRPDAPPVAVAPQPSPMREVVTGIGERARIRLGDGSRIVLAARSRIGIPADFGLRSREVEAEGEAYFEVAHDSTLPFIVHARGTRALDLGTAFVVRAYPEDPEVRLVVTEGSVAFGADSSHDPRFAAATLRRGEMGRLAPGMTSPVVGAVNPYRYTDWIEGRLSFDNAPLPEVIAELGRWHRTQILLADSSLVRETLTATLTADSFDDALQTLTTVLTLRAERNGSSVVLHRRGRRN